MLPQSRAGVAPDGSITASPAARVLTGCASDLGNNVATPEAPPVVVRAYDVNTGSCPASRLMADVCVEDGVRARWGGRISTQLR
jgi:hypothetical protein